jgi:hypothetical protein
VSQVGQVAEARPLVDLTDRGVFAQEGVEAHQRRPIAARRLVRLLGVLLSQELGDRPALFDAPGANDLRKERLTSVRSSFASLPNPGHPTPRDGDWR